MNNVSLLGRLTKEIELKKTESNKSVTTITLAIGDRFNKDHTDFINCVVWNQSAEYLNNYAHKGDYISLVGRISTRSYDGKHGKVFVTEVIADSVQIISSSKKEKENVNTNTDNLNGDIDISPDELPFY